MRNGGLLLYLLQVQTQETVCLLDLPSEVWVTAFHLEGRYERCPVDLLCAHWQHLRLAACSSVFHWDRYVEPRLNGIVHKLKAKVAMWEVSNASQSRVLRLKCDQPLLEVVDSFFNRFLSSFYRSWAGGCLIAASKQHACEQHQEKTVCLSHVAPLERVF